MRPILKRHYSSPTTSRASLPILNSRRRLANKQHDSSPLLQPSLITPTKSISTSSSDSDTQIPIAPPQRSTTNRTSSPASLVTAEKDPLKGVVACLDIRTEDGDDVSQNFENALKSMGAKTRKTFAESVTHLIYKNGSAINVRKALHNNCKIVNLLWITNCKSQGKRLPEDNYLIHQPENLLLAGSKRRKSMEPGRVKALVLNEQADKRALIDLNDDSKKLKRLKSPSSRTMPPAVRRRTQWETSAIISKETTNSNHSSIHRPNISLGELHDIDLDFDLTKDTISSSPPPTSEFLPRREKASSPPPTSDLLPRRERPSLPASFSRSMRRLSFNNDASSKLVSQKPTVNKDIKANFFIGTPSSPPPVAATTIIPESSPSSLLSPPPSTLVRRQRRSLTNRQSLTSSSTLPTRSDTSASSSLTLDTSTSSPAPRPALQQTTLDNTFVAKKETILSTIVMTSMDEGTKKKCSRIIQRLGKYKLASSVNEKTTHVIVGCQRRTQSVIMGLLQGVWLVTPEWLLDSDTANRYLDELTYEAILFYPRAKAARRKDPLLPSNLSVYINSSTMPLDLATQLVIKAGGIVAESIREADIVITNKPVKSDILAVTDNWLLESIEQWRYLSTSKYKPTYSA
ncbi:hypothetical protein BC941DRAFT_518977 [Chlamydoabsidia padenii]|nr:hypothetical protein BC941DRAFT_518977 [Chlamydoabsidia padenii]